MERERGSVSSRPSAEFSFSYAPTARRREDNRVINLLSCTGAYALRAYGLADADPALSNVKSRVNYLILPSKPTRARWTLHLTRSPRMKRRESRRAKIHGVPMVKRLIQGQHF